MSAKENVAVVLQVFNAIEQRDLPRVLESCCSDVEFHWPPSLPYGGISRGFGGDRPTWSATWAPLQPTETERKMGPRVVAASEEEVVVRWQQRGIGPTGERFDAPVLGLYRMRDRRLARAEMFYFDTAAVNTFLTRAKQVDAVSPERSKSNQ